MSAPDHDDQPSTARDSRRGRLDRHPDDYNHPSDWRPEGDPRDKGLGLVGLLVAGLLLLMLAVAVVFVFPDREDVMTPLPGGTSLPTPRLPTQDAPSLPIGGPG